VESFSHVESHFCNFNSNTTLYFVFIFIKIIFSLFYFNFFSLSSFFFSLSSFLFSSLCSRPTATHTHGSTTTPRPKPKPPSTQRHQPREPNPENPSHRQPRKSQPREPKPAENLNPETEGEEKGKKMGPVL
jgi:hypothetical protein